MKSVFLNEKILWLSACFFWRLAFFLQKKGGLNLVFRQRGRKRGAGVLAGGALFNLAFRQRGRKRLKKASLGQKLFAALLFFAAPSAFLSAAPQEAKIIKDIDVIHLYIGLQQDYPLPERFKKEDQLKFEGNYAKRTQAILRRSKNDIRFIPKKRGAGVLIIKNKRNEIIGRLHIEVQSQNLHKAAAEIRELLTPVDGIEIKIYNKTIFIDGQVLFPNEMSRIRSVMQKYTADGFEIKSLVTYSPEAQKKIAEIIEKEIGSPEVTVRYAYNRFILEGCVASASEKQRASDIANLYHQFDVASVEGGKKKQTPPLKNVLVVPCASEKKEEKPPAEIKKLIQVVVHFVEMEKSFAKGFLFQWTPGVDPGNTQVTATVGNNPQASSGLVAQLSATVSNFFPKLNWAREFGFARILHNSSLLIQNGESGSINVVTESESSAQGTAPRVHASVNVGITPEITGDKRDLVLMQVDVNVSSPAAGGANTSRKLNTKIHVRDGRSAAIGGIVSSILKKDFNRQPAQQIKGLPIINLYSQRGYSTVKSQFVIFITPMIKSSSSLGVERIKRRFKLDE